MFLQTMKCAAGLRVAGFFLAGPAATDAAVVIPNNVRKNLLQPATVVDRKLGHGQGKESGIVFMQDDGPAAPGNHTITAGQSVTEEQHGSGNFKNIKGDNLQPCAQKSTEAETGFTRDGYCTEQNDDAGSHHICINMKGYSENFCQITGQPNWCGEEHPCHEHPDQKCPIEHWCVCQWAFAGAMENKPDKADELCDLMNVEGTNMAAMKAYESSGDKGGYAKALECMKGKIGK